MDKIIKELKTISDPDKLGIISSTVIIIFSFFATTIDTLLTFLFGASMFTIFSGLSFSREDKEEIRTRKDDKGNIVEQERFKERILHFKKYPNISKALFFISVLLLLAFFIRLIVVYIGN